MSNSETEREYLTEEASSSAASVEQLVRFYEDQRNGEIVGWGIDIKGDDPSQKANYFLWRERPDDSNLPVTSELKVDVFPDDDKAKSAVQAALAGRTSIAYGPAIIGKKRQIILLSRPGVRIAVVPTPVSPNAPTIGSLGTVRARIAQELQTNPDLRRKLMASTYAEVGDQGSTAMQAYMESVMNRASARNQSLDHTISDPNYYPRTTLSKLNRTKFSKSLDPLIEQVLAGSNVAKYATGNESGSVHSGGAPVVFDPAIFTISRCRSHQETGAFVHLQRQSTSSRSSGADFTID